MAERVWITRARSKMPSAPSLVAVGAATVLSYTGSLAIGKDPLFFGMLGGFVAAFMFETRRQPILQIRFGQPALVLVTRIGPFWSKLNFSSEIEIQQVVHGLELRNPESGTKLVVPKAILEVIGRGALESLFGDLKRGIAPPDRPLQGFSNLLSQRDLFLWA
ncbi:MAG: hypothetical protein JRG89_24615, partial [Deltaproteobacteria bacterium]|nr:hypothetical protein [Deltaproteobacteria bacterium]